MDKILHDVKEFVSNKPKSKFIPGETYISPHGVDFDSNDVASLVQCALEGWYTEGKYSKTLARSLRQALDDTVRYVSLTNSGSSANLLALTALSQKDFGEKRIKRGDKVITTALGFPTTLNAILQVGAIPVFVDVDLHTFSPDMEALETAVIEGETKAVVLAHTLGNPFDSEKVEDVCANYDVYMVSDACDALGAKYKGKSVESYGDLATHSYYPAHHISGGEGGAVLMNSSQLYMAVNSLRNWGRSCFCNPGQDNACGKRFEHFLENGIQYDHKYIHNRIGYNLKLTDLQASLLVSQVSKLHNVVSARNYNYIYLSEKLDKFKEWLIFIEPINDNAEPSWFGFPIIIKDYVEINRRDLINYLNKRKVGTRMIFGGNLLHQPAYKDIEFEVIGDLYNSDLITKNGFWIGLHPGITIEMMDYIAEVFEDFFVKGER